jgi:hypothetical protein
MDFLKKIDMYEPSLTFHQTKSAIRGLGLLIATVLSIIVFFISIYFRIIDPQILTTLEMRYLPMNLLIKIQ